MFGTATLPILEVRTWTTVAMCIVVTCIAWVQALSIQPTRRDHRLSTTDRVLYLEENLWAGTQLFLLYFFFLFI